MTIAARLGGLDEPLDAGVGQIEEGTVLLRRFRLGGRVWSSDFAVIAMSIELRGTRLPWMRDASLIQQKLSRWLASARRGATTNHPRRAADPRRVKTCRRKAHCSGCARGPSARLELPFIVGPEAGIHNLCAHFLPFAFCGVQRDHMGFSAPYAARLLLPRGLGAGEIPTCLGPDSDGWGLNLVQSCPSADRNASRSCCCDLDDLATSELGLGPAAWPVQALQVTL